MNEKCEPQILNWMRRRSAMASSFSLGAFGRSVNLGNFCPSYLGTT